MTDVKIPKEEWWCGCSEDPVTTWDSQKDFVQHMKLEHSSSWPEILKEIIHKQKMLSKGGN